MKEIVCIFKWEGGTNLDNLLPTEINRIFASTALQLQKAVPGGKINTVTANYAGKTVTVPTAEFAHT